MYLSNLKVNDLHDYTVRWSNIEVQNYSRVKSRMKNVKTIKLF